MLDESQALPILRSSPQPLDEHHRLRDGRSPADRRAPWRGGDTGSAGFIRVRPDLHRLDAHFARTCESVESGKAILLAALIRVAPEYVREKIAAARLEHRRWVLKRANEALDRANEAQVHAAAEVIAAEQALAEEEGA